MSIRPSPRRTVVKSSARALRFQSTSAACPPVSFLEQLRRRRILPQQPFPADRLPLLQQRFILLQIGPVRTLPLGLLCRLFLRVVFPPRQRPAEADQRAHHDRHAHDPIGAHTVSDTHTQNHRRQHRQRHRQCGPSTNSIGCFFRLCFCGGASMSITSCGSGSKNRGLRKNASCACGSGLSSRAGGA